MNKSLFVVPFVVGATFTDAYAHNLRNANITVNGNVYDAWVNQESGDIGSYQIAPGNTECFTGDIIIEYFDDGSMDSIASLCVLGIDCFPGNAECYDGSTNIKLCSEYIFQCVAIESGAMHSIDGINDSFECIQGYYKNKMSCERCPSSGGIYGTTAGTGATSITECFIPAGSGFSDDTGNGVYSSDCYYIN